MFLLTNQDDESSGQGKIVKVGDELRVAPGYEEVYGVIEGHVFQAGERDRLYENDGRGNFREGGATAALPPPPPPSGSRGMGSGGPALSTSSLANELQEIKDAMRKLEMQVGWESEDRGP